MYNTIECVEGTVRNNGNNLNCSAKKNKNVTHKNNFAVRKHSITVTVHVQTNFILEQSFRIAEDVR